MFPSVIILFSVLGLTASLVMAGLFVQPDWAFALLLAAILAKRASWPWVLPAVFLHDLTLHWNAFAFLPVMALLPFLLLRMDEQLGPALPQRLLLMFVASLSLLFVGWGFAQWMLTLLLCVPIWYLLVRNYAQYA